MVDMDNGLVIAVAQKNVDKVLKLEQGNVTRLLQHMVEKTVISWDHLLKIRVAILSAQLNLQEPVKMKISI